MREEAQRVLDELVKDDVREIKLLQEHLHDGLGQLIYDRTKRRPMILPWWWKFEHPARRARLG